MSCCSAHCPAGLHSLFLMGTWPLQSHRFSSSSRAPFLNPLWQCRLHMNCKSWASWLHTNQVNTIKKIFIIVQLSGPHTYRQYLGTDSLARHLSGFWFCLKNTFGTELSSEFQTLSHSSCQFTFQTAILSLQFPIMITNGRIRIRSLLHRQTELMCYAKQVNYYEPVSYSF